MRSVLKWITILIGALIGLALLALVSIYYITESKLNQTYEFNVDEVVIPTDQASIERGRHLVTTMGFCTECHVANFSGQVWDDGPLVGKLAVNNLTRGQGGVGSTFTDADWVRALRHGVGQDGKSLIIMPSNLYNGISDADLGAIIAYLKQIPAVDNQLPETTIGPMARMFILQDPSMLPAQVIDHDKPRPPDPEPGVTAAYGEYLATVCIICHGENLAGEAGAGGGLNLTPAGDLGEWTEEEFINTMRSGNTPEGETLDEEIMPWRSLGQMTDDELKAIWLYLQTIPPVETVEGN
ncbi:MAG TPA: c-type cytochrome [Anaerolineales bacterium]